MVWMIGAALTLLGLAISILRNRIPWIGRVVRVVDGDSIEARFLWTTRRIRLSAIDAPEWTQPHGREATAALERIALGRTALLLPSGTDTYGRWMCHVVVGGRVASWSLALHGHAWGQGFIPRILSWSACMRKAGLWSDPRRVDPRIWRLAMRKGMRASRR